MTEKGARERLAILVHEVRSPVAAIAAIAETSRNDDLDRDARRSLTRLAVAACRAIERIVGDANVASVRIEPVDIGEVVAQAVDAAKLRGASVRAIVKPGLPSVDADPVRLRQALDNLIVNALTHGSAEREVVVHAEVREQELRVSVADSGPGIPFDDQERIFEAGVRLDPEVHGSGLGLAVVREIADAHGAAVVVDSSPAGGATFTLVFPLDQPAT